MKESVYKSYEELPLFLNARIVAQVLGIAPSSAYELMHESNFPVLKVGSRMVVPREKFIQWVELWQYTKRDAVKNFFPLPNEIFSLGLSSGALAVYSYLLYCEDRKTYQCYPSCRSIGKAVHMSVNTVRKYVAELEGRGLIITEPTSIITRDGRKHNGTLRYTILSIQNAVDLYNQRQLWRLEETVEQMRVSKELEGNEVHPA